MDEQPASVAPTAADVAEAVTARVLDSVALQGVHMCIARGGDEFACDAPSSVSKPAHRVQALVLRAAHALAIQSELARRDPHPASQSHGCPTGLH